MSVEVETRFDGRQLDRMIRKIDTGTFTQYVVSQAEYSIYQELGNKYMDANPFLGPALHVNRPQLALSIKRYGLFNIDKAVRDTAQIVAHDARLLAPYKTGYLRGNIRAQDEIGS